MTRGIVGRPKASPIGRVKGGILRKDLRRSNSTTESQNHGAKKDEKKKNQIDKSISLPIYSPSRKRKSVIISTSPRKTRGIHKKEEDLECESCGQSEPLQYLHNCPNCFCVFHLTCLGLERNTIEFFMEHLDKWQCPRCITCAKCEEYIFDANNVQCELCGRAFHGHCRPQKSAILEYPYSRWFCEKCETSGANLKISSFASEVKQISSVTPTKSALKSAPKRVRSCNLKSSTNKSGVTKSTSKKSTKKELIKVEEDLHETVKEICENGNAQRNFHDNFALLVKQEQHFLGTPVTSGPKKRGRKRKVDSEAAEVLKELDTNENSDFSLAGKMALQKMNVLNQWVYFGQHIRFKPIYESSYPENIGSSPNVYVCEFCLRAMADLCQFKNHLTFCRWRHPPGNEIYRDDSVSIWEVGGRDESIYCRNLCLLSKFFLSSKTLYHEVETFTFYILTEITDRGCVLAGYFSKEKNPSKNNNLSCLLTLPSHQSKGYGKMLIDLSYRLSMREHKIGSPEHPLSDMGLIAYRSYWRSVIVCALRRRRNHHAISIKELSIETAVHSCDIIATLLALGKLSFRNDSFYIDTNLAFNASLSSFRRRTVDEGLFFWLPHFEVIPGNKMNSYAAD